MDILISFDVSSKCTGFSVIKNGRFRRTKNTWGKIEPPSNMTLSEKLSYFRKEVVKLLEKHKPTRIIVEDVYIRFMGVAAVLYRFSGVILEATYTVTGNNAELLTATTVRKILGCGKKKDAYDYVVKRYNILDWKFSTHNDVTDSIALGLAALKGNKDGFTKEKTKRVKRKKRKS